MAHYINCSWGACLTVAPADLQPISALTTASSASISGTGQVPQHDDVQKVALCAGTLQAMLWCTAESTVVPANLQPFQP